MATKTKTPVARHKSITRSYLMWVGAEHYTDIKAYSDEAVAMGISKRMPTADMAETLAQPGTVVFLAHDEGEHKDCPACIRMIDCPECRKRGSEAKRLLDECVVLMDAAKSEAEADAINKKVEARIAKLNEAITKCEMCKGETELRAGSGGIAKVDGKIWDYRRYNYWLHQPAKWSPDDHKIELDMCKVCGGKGELPQGKVFGLFIPSAIEWIMPEGADAELVAEMKARGFKAVPESVLVGEAKRGCGKRHAGGCYVVTSAGESSADAKRVLADLIKAGVVKPKGAELSGNFIRFLSPVPIEAKRFRGLKTWGLDPKAEREAEMILEAVAG